MEIGMQDRLIMGIIGGSGLYDFPGLENMNSYELDTPFGKPSSPIITGSLNGKKIAFLARHGIGHILSPSEVNYRANIFALKSLGVSRVLSVSACGSLREDYAPGEIIIPDQIFDHTHKRARTFFENGVVAHVGAPNPFCPQFSQKVYSSLKKVKAPTHLGGTFITIEGPRFSTIAESNVYRSWGMSIIGMTACPEVFLAREAEMCYVTMAHVTDYDVWHSSEDPVSVEMVIRTLHNNTATAQNAIRLLLQDLDDEETCECQTSLKDTLMTRPDLIPAKTISRLEILIKKYL
jgi:5'-methylthioadenosine phosphorylase